MYLRIYVAIFSVIQRLNNYLQLKMLAQPFLFFTLLLHTTHANDNTYYVTTDEDHHYPPTDNFHTLKHYLANATEFIRSHTFWYFLPGYHQLDTDLTITDIENFTLAGKNSTIVCGSLGNLEIISVENFKLSSINFLNCGKKRYFDKITISASIILTKCFSVQIYDIDIYIDMGIVGLYAKNVKNTLNITDLTIHVNCSVYPKSYSHISGVLIYFWNKERCTNSNSQKHNAIINLYHYQYKTRGLCQYYNQFAITLLSYQECYNVSINILSMVLMNLKNSSLLYYSGKTSDIGVESTVTIKDCLIINNTGNAKLRMFHVELKNRWDKLNDLTFLRYNEHRNMIYFENCTFKNNANMAAIIHVTPASSQIVAGYIKIRHSVFSNNNQVHLIKVKGEAEIIWQLTTIIEINTIKVLSNKHKEGDSLIFVTNGAILFVGSVLFMNNSFYTNIIELHLSIALLKGYTELTGNIARKIVKAKSGSYFILMENSTVNMSRNSVYVVAKQARTFGDDSRPICPIQFHSFKGNIDKKRKNQEGIPLQNLYKVLMLNNIVHMLKNLPGEDISFGNCTWLAGTAFLTTPAKFVYQRVLEIIINTTTRRMIPLSVCPCINANKYDCYSPNLGSVFPGQTMTVKLLVKEKWLMHGDSSTTLIVANTPDDACSVVDSYQLSQTHFNHGCNDYRYTIWPSHGYRDECTLFLGINDMPEMFYIEIKSCPKGFILDKAREACYCDPLLHNKILSITSCDLDGETILRPASSWITADTVNGSHTYFMSSACPFDYCLPHSSHHKLSDPDSQCQFNRSGVLCGQCKQGLSDIFGSSQCKQCSNIYLLMYIILIHLVLYIISNNNNNNNLLMVGIVGIAVVIMLFMFHFTVINGVITSFIFYFNIIYINYLVFFPGCHSTTCAIIMFINLDSRTKTCFYNGMDTYALTWLILAFPTYLALLLILMSRYFTRIQRITAKKVLPVLATLFLLSYTKALRIVCRVLFRYFTLTHLPSNHTKVVWLVSVSTPLFGLKFLLLLIFCIVLFLILLPFNVILLFTRTLSRFKVINSFKTLLDTYFAPYKDKAFYWTGLLLLIRTVILALLVFTEDVSLIATSILLGGLLWWHGVVQPFRSKFENVHESALIFNLLAVHAVPLYRGGFRLAQILIMISVFYFLIVIVFYCFIYRFKNTIQYRIKRLFNIICKIKQSLADDQDSVQLNNIADVTYKYNEFQEPLVEYDE